MSYFVFIKFCVGTLALARGINIFVREVESWQDGVSSMVAAAVYVVIAAWFYYLAWVGAML